MENQKTLKGFIKPLPPGRRGLCAALGAPPPSKEEKKAPFAAFAYNIGDDGAGAAAATPASASPAAAAAGPKRPRALVSDEEEEDGGGRSPPPRPAAALLSPSPATLPRRPAPQAPPEEEVPHVILSSDEEEAAAAVDAAVAAAVAAAAASTPSPSSPTPEPDAPVDVMAEVGRIGADLRAALEGGGGGGGGPGACPSRATFLPGDRVTGAEPGAGTLLSAAMIADACVNGRGGEAEEEEEEGDESGSESEEGSDDDDDAPAPAPPPPPLKPYQVVGVNFLALLRSRGLSAILADEMGLGKSAQAAAFLAVRAASGEEDLARPFLVVVPASLLDNWARELATWAPGLSVARYYGPHREDVRAVARARARAGRPGPGFDVALASYNPFSADSTAARVDRKWLRSVDWSIVVLDEAHAIKNAGAARSAKLASVASGAAMRVCLTGTPLQNRPAELRALLAFLMPSLFEGLEGEEGEEEEEGGGGGGGGPTAADAASLRRLLAPFILRRLKSEVATQLVPKTVETRLVAMVPAQAAVYASTVAALRSEAAEASGGGCGGGGNGAADEAGRALVRALGPARAASSFTLLRKLAMHPLLARSGAFGPDDLDTLARAASAAETFSTTEVDRVRSHLDGLSDFELYRLGASLRLGARFRLPRGAVGAGSGKAAFLADLLPRLHAEGHRVLLFSQWTMTLDLMEVLLDDAGLSWKRLDGGTKVSDRLDLVDAFNNDCGGPGGPSKTFALLMSTAAGGVGLSLTGADTVILHDLSWNPSVDKQAEDRAHRLGATRPVRVIRLITGDSVDAAVARTAERKLALADAVLGEEDGGGGGAGESGPASEIGAALAQVLAGA